VNCALCSEHATSVDLCLFDAADGHQEVARTALMEQTDLAWDVYSPEVSLIRENEPYELEARSLALLRLQSPLGSGSRSKT
jgi:pullulanase/glycogen debranching enzyme